MDVDSLVVNSTDVSYAVCCVVILYSYHLIFILSSTVSC